MNEFTLFENRTSPCEQKDTLFFSHKVADIICYQGEELASCLEQMEKYQQRGFYLAGFMSYEASYYLLPTLPKTLRDLSFPLLHFNVFSQVDYLSHEETAQRLADLNQGETEKILIQDLHLTISEQEYHRVFEKIKKYIYDGHTYQVNFTDKYLFRFQGSPIYLYRLLRERQKVPYSGLFYFQNYQILSLSPELFFLKKDSHLTMQPMKGTMPRSLDPEKDAFNKHFLTTDAKTIAENIMIVDLIRNDLNRLAFPATVTPKALLHVASYETLHQMTSTIACEIEKERPFKQIISHLFPCGSVTGAPKIRTMQLIHELENAPRQVYTGALGYITPQNDMCFNVPIRTLLLKNNKGELGVGSGIVHDSDVQREFQEMQLKADFFTKMPGVVMKNA